MSSTMRNLTYWMAAALVIFLFWSVSSRIQVKERQLSFSEFMGQLERGHVARVTIAGSGAGSQIVGEYKNGQSLRTFAPPQMESLVDVMLDKGVEVHARDPNRSSWLGHLISWTPIIIMIAFLIFFMRRMQSDEDAPPFRETVSREKRLEIKAHFLNALSTSGTPLSETELLSSLGERAKHVSETEHRKALYEMLRDGVVLLTEDKKYKLRTAA